MTGIPSESARPILGRVVPRRALVLLFALAIAAAQTLVAEPPQQEREKWIAGKYHGLVVGKSSKADVLRVLGSPESRGHEPDTGLPYMQYRVSDPVSGQLLVFIHKQSLSGISLYPQGELNRGDIVKVLGPHYRTVHYSVDDCLDEGGAAPIYEDPRGPIEQLEYRNRGIAVAMNGETVEAILYIAKAFPTHSRCGTKGHK